MPELEFFTVVCQGVGAIQVDYVDLGDIPDEEIVYAFVDFVPREEPGTVHWLAGLTNPRGIALDTVRGRFSPEDGRLRTIVGKPTDEQQVITATGTPITLTYAGQTTAPFANTATPPQVQAALEALSNIGVGDVYVYGTLRNEKQTVTIGGAPTGGTFVLGLDGATTEPIFWNATSSQVQAALQRLPGLGDVVSVSGPSGGPWIVEFTGSQAGVNVNQMTAGPRGETQTVTLKDSPTGGNFSLAFMGQITAPIAYNASAVTVRTALEALSNIAPGDVIVSGNAGGPYTIGFAGAYAAVDVPALMVVYRNTVQGITISGSPLAGNFQLSFQGILSSPMPFNAAATLVKQRLEELSSIGKGNVAVTGNAGGPFTVVFQNALGNLALPLLGFSHSFTGGGSPSLSVGSVLAGIGLFGGASAAGLDAFSTYLQISTVFHAAALEGGTVPSVTVATTQTGSAGTPWTVTFIGALHATDIAQMTATNATVVTTAQGPGDVGVKLVANTPVMELDELVYDVRFTVPDLDPLKEDRIITPFGIVAPTTGGTVVDLANASAHIPPRPL